LLGVDGLLLLLLLLRVGFGEAAVLFFRWRSFFSRRSLVS